MLKTSDKDMILTGKAKEDFVKYSKRTESWMSLYDDIFLHALIIDWLDSVGINIEIEITDNDFNKNVCYSYAIYGEYKFEDCIGYKTRQEANKAAVEKANELHNKSKNQ